MTKHLQTPKRAPSMASGKLQPKGLSRRSALRAKADWTPERRARQQVRIRLTQPWRHSTGPKTETGKARVAMNAFRHGCRGRAWLEKARRIRQAIRLCAATVLLARVLMLEAKGLASPPSRVAALRQRGFDPLATDASTAQAHAPALPDQRQPGRRQFQPRPGAAITEPQAFMSSRSVDERLCGFCSASCLNCCVRRGCRRGAPARPCCARAADSAGRRDNRYGSCGSGRRSSRSARSVRTPPSRP